MEQFLIGIPLPPSLQKILARLAFGLSNASWYDSSFFHIALQPLGVLDRGKVIDVALALKEVAHPSFFLTLRGLGLFERKKDVKTIGVAVSPSVDVQKLKTEIHHKLREIGIQEIKNSFQPHIPLGLLTAGNETKVGMFLIDNSAWSYSPLFISSFALLAVHTTAKNSFYTIEEEFPLKQSLSVNPG